MIKEKNVWKFLLVFAVVAILAGTADYKNVYGSVGFDGEYPQVFLYVTADSAYPSSFYAGWDDVGVTSILMTYFENSDCTGLDYGVSGVPDLVGNQVWAWRSWDSNDIGVGIQSVFFTFYDGVTDPTYCVALGDSSFVVTALPSGGSATSTVDVTDISVILLYGSAVLVTLLVIFIILWIWILFLK